MDLIPQKQEQLKEIIKSQGIFIQDVTLSSNLKSDVYYDIKTVVNSEGVVLIGELMFDKIRKLFPTAKSVGGLNLEHYQFQPRLCFSVINLVKVN